MTGSATPAPERPLDRQVRALRRRLREEDPARLAARAGATWHERERVLRLRLWGQPVRLDWPELAGRDEASNALLPGMSQALLAYYLWTADGTPLADRWIAFTELPDGQFYTRAFEGYSGGPLAATFGDDLAAFGRAARAVAGAPLSLGDAAFAFAVLPRVSVAAVAWLGDEDFPPSYRILFDAAVPHQLPTDACAIVGSALTRRLVAGHSQEKP